MLSLRTSLLGLLSLAAIVTACRLELPATDIAASVVAGATAISSFWDYRTTGIKSNIAVALVWTATSLLNLFAFLAKYVV